MSYFYCALQIRKLVIGAGIEICPTAQKQFFSKLKMIKEVRKQEECECSAKITQLK